MKKIIAIFAVFALMCGSVIAQNTPKGGNASKTKNAVKAKTMGKPRVPKKAAAVTPGSKPAAKPTLKTTK